MAKQHAPKDSMTTLKGQRIPKRPVAKSNVQFNSPKGVPAPRKGGK